MSDNQPLIGTFHDAITGETVTRELTAEEIELLSKPTDGFFADESVADEPAVDEIVVDESVVE